MKAIIAAFMTLAVFSIAGAEEWPPDIEYGTADGVSLRLDASVPPGEGPFPVVILIHGGGWGGGDKRQDFSAISKPLTDAGFVWFTINYRLAPQHRWPACFQDVQSAIRWVRAHAAEHKGDPRRIALLGYSAGGHLAALAAIRADDSTRVQAVVGLAPAVDLVTDAKRRGEVSVAMRNLLDLPQTLDETALRKIGEISPAEELRPGLPPFLLLQGSADQSVPPPQTLAFSVKLREMRVPCEFVTLENAPHRIADWPKFLPDYPDRIVKWLNGVLRESP